jgi:hypothetical protein
VIPGRGAGTVRLIGGPLDGEELPADDFSDTETGGGAHMIVDGWEQRADYEPVDGGDPLIWHYRGPVTV